MVACSPSAIGALPMRLAMVIVSVVSGAGLP
jgi:hypothetical protein